jgi:hypothetical protein
VRTSKISLYYFNDVIMGMLFVLLTEESWKAKITYFTIADFLK